MTETDLSYVLLRYIRNQLGNPSIQYKKKPSKLAGGLHTGKYRFQLENTPEHLSHPLVIRIFPHSLRSGYAKGEAMIQNAVHSIGYPAPRVFFHTSDKTSLGGEFTIMEYKQGVTLMETGKPDIPETVAVLQKELHELDAEYLMKTLDIPKSDTTRYSMVDYLEENINKLEFSRLYPALEWVIEHRLEREPVVLCHGDFHQGNILWHKGKVSAVLDWGTYRFEEPYFDVARFLVAGKAFLPVVFPDIDCDDFLSRFELKYRELCDINQERLEFYKAVNGLYGLFAWENGVEPFGIPMVQRQYIETFKELSGIEVPFLPK